MEFSVDDPDEEKAFFLQDWDRNLLDGLITQTAVLNGDSSGRLRAGESPRWIHHDDIKFSLGDFYLLFDETLEVKLGDVCTNGDSVVSHK